MFKFFYRCLEVSYCVLLCSHVFYNSLQLSFIAFITFFSECISVRADWSSFDVFSTFLAVFFITSMARFICIFDLSLPLHISCRSTRKILRFLAWFYVVLQTFHHWWCKTILHSRCTERKAHFCRWVCRMSFYVSHNCCPFLRSTFLVFSPNLLWSLSPLE